MCIYSDFIGNFAPNFCTLMNHSFAQYIEEWYRHNGRDLPWRGTEDPYAIWISETILQQTRVAQGMDYYHRFMRRFPTVEDLARAEEDEVLLLWQGLGYYSRARNLHAAARQLVELGGFPRDYKDVLTLKGVGEYTAAAICSFAYGQPYAVLDGNVYRVLSRYLGIEEPIDTTPGKRLFRTLADEMLDTQYPALYNQAIMDYGAVVCTPKSPACATCPLMESCVAFRVGMVDELPRKSRRTRVRDRFFTYLYLLHPERGVYLHRREKGDIWQGLYELYCHESDAPLNPTEAAALLPGCKLLRSVCGITHQLSHQLLHADCHLLHTTMNPDALSGLWVSEQQLQDYAMPQLIVRLIEKIVMG